MPETADAGYLGIPGARKHVVETRKTRTGQTAFIQAGSADTWRPVIGALAERYSVVAPDLAGHGQSSGPPLSDSVEPRVDGIDSLCAYLGVETATVVGHSLGGLVAMRFALDYPDRLTHLLLADAGGIGHDFAWLLRLAAIPVLGRAVFGPARLLVKHYGKRVQSRGGVDTNLLKGLHRSRAFHVSADVVRGGLYGRPRNASAPSTRRSCCPEWAR
jgi:pimeloyl-ACP methyl ester carboxylesterase